MHTLSEEDAWRTLHGGHVGMQTMRYQSQVWGIPAKTNMLKKTWEACDICQRQRDVRRSETMGAFNRFSKLGEALGMDYVGPILLRIGLVRKKEFVKVCKRFKSKYWSSERIIWSTHHTISFLIPSLQEANTAQWSRKCTMHIWLARRVWHQFNRVWQDWNTE